MLTVFFTDGPVTDYASAKRADTARYARYFHAMREGGVFLAPSQFEAAFVSLAHGEDDLAAAARACRGAMEAVAARRSRRRAERIQEKKLRADSPRRSPRRGSPQLPRSTQALLTPGIST